MSHGQASLAREYGAGEIVFRAGDPGSTMFVVLQGQVEILDTTGARLTLVDQGATFGEIALIDDGPRSATARAAHPGTRLAVLDRLGFVHLLAEQPAFALAVLASLAGWLRATTPFPAPALPVVAARPAGRGYAPVPVLPGLWQLRSQGRGANAYLVQGGDAALLVDCGLDATFDSLAGALREAGTPPDRIATLVLTHEHFDHAAAAPRFGAATQCLAHGLAASRLALADDTMLVSRAFGVDATPIAVHATLADGQRLAVGAHVFTVLHSPGHCAGAIVLHDAARGVLITGDTVLAGGALGGVFPSGSLGDYVATLERLAALDVRWLLPGHGRVSDQANADIVAALASARALFQQSRSLLRSVATTEAFSLIMRALRGANRAPQA